MQKEHGNEGEGGQKLDDSPAVSRVPDRLRRKRRQVVDAKLSEENDRKESDKGKDGVPEPCPARESEEDEEHGEKEEITPGIQEVIADGRWHSGIGREHE